MVRVVANRPIPLPSGARHAMIVVSEDDTADEYILRALGKNDIVVTRDTVLAEQIAKNGNTVLNDRGDQFDADAARERRSIRDFSMTLKNAGLRRTPDGSRGAREVKRFADALDRAITRAKTAQKAAQREA